LSHLGLLQDYLYLFYGDDYDGDDDEVVVVILTEVEVVVFSLYT
jgi:hypothetical protein